MLWLREIHTKPRSYVLRRLCMTRSNTVISIKSRSSYGTHLLQNWGEIAINGNNRSHQSAVLRCF